MAVKMEDNRFPDDVRYIGFSGGQVMGPNRYADDGHGLAPSFFDGENVVVVLEDEHGVGKKPIPLAYVIARCFGARHDEPIGFRNEDITDVRLANLFWKGFPKPQPVPEPVAVETEPEPAREAESRPPVDPATGRRVQTEPPAETEPKGTTAIDPETGLPITIGSGDATKTLRLGPDGEPIIQLDPAVGTVVPS